jgi:hypothetical protein
MPAVIPCITQTKAEAGAELETLPGVTAKWIEKRLAALPERPLSTRQVAERRPDDDHSRRTLFGGTGTDERQRAVDGALMTTST